MKLISYRKNIYSQNGEDGIIEEILNRLNIKEGSFVEFGALDGVTFSNTYNLLKNKNWQGFYIESDKNNYFHLEKLKEIYKEKLIILNERVEIKGESSLDNLIKKHTNFSKEFDLLSIDIDSFDYQIFENLQEYKPTIIIIEVESTIHPPKEQIHDGIKNFRTSFSSMAKLGQTKGYTAICHTGNIIFIKNDKLNQIKLEEEYIQNPSQLFLSKGWYFQNPGTAQTISWKEEFKKNIFSFNIENNLDFYKKENFQNQLSICKFFDNYKNNEKFNLHFYWQDYGSPFNEKHALSIKSAITTQNLNNCKIILWSNKDLSENEYFKPLLPFIEHKIWDMQKQLKDFGLENLSKILQSDKGIPALVHTADLFKILSTGLYGGISSDLDVIFLKDFSPLLNYEFTYFWPLINSQNNAIVRIDYQSDFFKNIIQVLKNNSNFNNLNESLYKKVRENFKDYSIFPTSWFDGDWLNIDFKDNFKSNKKQLFYDDAFAWHWHNHWNEPVEKDSKFDIYKNRIDKNFYNILNMNKTVSEDFAINKTIYCFWLSKNEMNDKRKECLNSIIKYSESKVELITLNNLEQYILKDHPLHEGFKYLSAVHKSDYLRSYFMHFYGGGYTDIKENKNSWKQAFELLDKNHNLYGVGYRAFLGCFFSNQNLNKFLNKNLKYLIGNSAFIFKKQTQLTLDWYKSIELHMDSILQDLKKYPAQYNRDQRVTNGTLLTLWELGVKNLRKDYFYPLEWEEIQGQIFYPLIYKYKENISYILKGPSISGNCAENYGCHIEKEI
jgi:hypothetical protein